MKTVHIIDITSGTCNRAAGERDYFCEVRFYVMLSAQISRYSGKHIADRRGD